MNHTIAYRAAVAVSLCLVALGIPGCGTRSETEFLTQPGPPAAADGHADDGGGGLSEMEQMKTALAKLSPEDAASAEKQQMCLVSGEMLGTMGAPIKVEVKGQQVWICCEGCRKPLLENPDEFLAKLNN